MFKIIYLPTAQEVKLPTGCRATSEYELKKLLYSKYEEVYSILGRDELRFLTYNEMLRGDFISGNKIPKHLLEVLEVDDV